MGRRTQTQRAGKGSPTYRSLKNALAVARYIDFDEKQRSGRVVAEVLRLKADTGHSGVLAEMVLEDGRKCFVLAAEGIFEGEKVEFGEKAEISIGNVLPLNALPEGCPVFAIELSPGDGGKIVRSSGLYALVMAKEKKTVLLKMPSGKMVSVNSDSRATIGCSSGGARTEKPFVKAGAKFFAQKAKHKKYPRVRGVAMNPVSHPHGGGAHHVGRSKSISRHAPPGAKAGAIASKRTGRKKK